MGMFSKIGSFFSLQEEEDDDELYEEAPSGSPSRVVPFSQNSSKRAGTEVSVYSLRGFQDVVEIADALRRRQVVIVNLQTADRATLQRVVDFTSGVTYTIDGRIQKLAESIYLVVPAGVTVNSANLREQMSDDGMLDLSARFGNGTRNER